MKLPVWDFPSAVLRWHTPFGSASQAAPVLSEKGKPYNHIEPTISKIKNPENIPFVQALKTFAELARGITGGYEYETEKNPLYPEESYEQFIAALIDKKKKKIERVLDLQ